MYKKILIPTDGSPISNAAAKAGVEFAKQLGASVVGLFVAPEYQYPVFVEIIPPSFPTEEEYMESMRKAGDMYVQTIRDAANTEGLAFTGMTVFSDATAQQIVRVTEKEACDLIFIGSHGRSGWGQALLGSVTNKVLSSCKIPVLVYRVAEEPSHEKRK
ncbi:MAG: universal stress protein [Burkholderiales bacterium]|nr:universal stress protein [Burkholderiales bacterium]